MKRWPILCVCLSGGLLVAGCDQMRLQPRYDAFAAGSLFPDGKVDQAPPDGTVAQEDASFQAAAESRPPMTLALIERGRQRYGIDCVQCHDAAGYGRGVVPSRGFPRPPSFHSPQLRSMTARQIVGVIEHGYGVMYPHGDRVAPADRWAIAAYVQALQLSQAAPAAALQPADLAQVEARHER